MVRKGSTHIIVAILFVLALFGWAAPANARVFNEGDVLYANQHPSNWDWYGNTDAGLFAYFFKNGTSLSAWSEEAISECEGVLLIRVPAGDWTHVILTRNKVHSNPAWNNVHNNGNNNVQKTADIEIPANQNYLDNFYQYKEAEYHPNNKWHWSNDFGPCRPAANPRYASAIDLAEKEVVQVCPQSEGDPLSLQPRLINQTDGYDYNQTRTWYKWDGGSWKELPYSKSNWGFDGPGGLNETIGSQGTHTYYFLSTQDRNKQRFIEIAVTKNCSSTCEITDFGVVTSSVNAVDSTYTLDGVVAFGDASGKTLRISVKDAKGEHYVDFYNPTTPFIFSLPNLYADGTTGIKATARFLNTDYSRESNAYDAPVIQAGVAPTIVTIPHYETYTLEPSTDGAGGFKWHDGNTTDHERSTESYDFDTTLVYTYYEFEPTPPPSGNLIKNGDFATTDESFYGTVKRSNVISGSAISDYNFWGKDVTTGSDFYDKFKEGSSASLFGGFSIVTDANQFWKRFTKKITPKNTSIPDDRYALFDADNSGSKKAWFVDSNKSPDLKLDKGTNYMFSFWVANINNYGEMNNAAKLQFAIRYQKADGSWSTEELLGNPIDLNEYKDNIWHQNSHVYASQVDATNVEIMVRDLNNSANPGGNDFALDDIQFQAISVHSQAIKNCERFVVHIFEEPVTVNPSDIAITQTPQCGDDQFTMDVTVNYSTLNDKYPISLQLTDNIYGDLFTTPISIDPALNPDAITFHFSSTEYPMLKADGKVHTLTAQIIRYDHHGEDKGGSYSTTYTAPGVPAIIKKPEVKALNVQCDLTTFDLQVATEYKAFKGSQLRYEWDGADWTDANYSSLSYNESDFQTATDTLKNLPADGKLHNLRVYSENATLDCDYTVTDVQTPYSPEIRSVTAEVQNYQCGDDYYKVQVTVNYSNAQDRDLIITDENGHEKRLVSTDAAYTPTKATWTFDMPWEDPVAEHTFKAYFEGADSCKNYHLGPYVSPAKPRIENIVRTLTQVTDLSGYITYNLTVTFDYYNMDALSVDIDGITSITPSFIPNSPTKQSATVTFTGLSANGQTHTINVGNSHTCSDQRSVSIPLANQPVISSLSYALTPPDYYCGAPTFHVTLNVAYLKASGSKLIVVQEDGTNLFTSNTLTGDGTEPISLNLDFSSNHTLKVYFDDQPTYAETVPVNTPAKPEINVTPKIVNTDCDKTTYDLDVVIQYTNQDGILSVDVDGVSADPATLNFIPNSNIQQTLTAKVKDLPADGTSGHTLHVAFSGTHGCSTSMSLPAAPYGPQILSTQAEVIPYECGDTDYAVKVTVQYTNSQDHDLIITDENGHEKRLVSTDAAYAATSATWTFHDLPWEDPVASHTFQAYFVGAESCKDNAPHQASYRSPIKRPELIGDTIASYCQGSSFEWNGIEYTVADMPITHTYTSKLAPYCDSIVTLTLIEWPSYDMPADTDTIIEGESYTWNRDGETYTTSGTYEWNPTTKAHGCDSIYTLHLKVLENKVENVTFQISEPQCAGEGVFEMVVHHTGFLTDARLTFDAAALQAGFRDTVCSLDNDSISIPFDSIRAGHFSMKIELLFRDRVKYTAFESFTLLFPSTVLEQGWMDAIFVLTSKYNGGYNFKKDAFQWYKNGYPLVGETGPYLYQPLKVGDQYSAMLTDEESGITLLTCPLTIVEQIDSFPYPIEDTAYINLSIAQEREMLRVSVSQNAVLTIYSLMGERICRHTLVQGDTPVEAPRTPGIYIAEAVSQSGKRKVIKIIVR